MKTKIFDKKADRAHYFIATVIVGLFALGAEYINFEGDLSPVQIILFFVYVIYYFMALVYLLLVTIWRLNDLHKPRWQILLMWIPLINLFLGLQLFFSEGGVKTTLKQDIKKQMSTDKKSLLIILIGLPVGLLLLAILMGVIVSLTS